MDNTYLIATKYERFIRKVFNCDVNKHGAHLCNMQNVMFMEQGKSYSKHLGSFEKQFLRVQGYIEKALKHLIKETEKKELKDYYEVLLDDLSYSEDSSSLMSIVSLAFEKVLDARKD